MLTVEGEIESRGEILRKKAAGRRVGLECHFKSPAVLCEEEEEKAAEKGGGGVEGGGGGGEGSEEEGGEGEGEKGVR